MNSNFLLLLPCALGALILNDEVDDLKSYLNDVWKCVEKHETVVVSDVMGPVDGVLDWFLTETNNVYLTDKSGLEMVCEQLSSDVTFFIFASTKQQATEYIHLINMSYMYSSTYFIVLCSQEQVDETDLLEGFWSTYRILDCFLITCHNFVHLTTYNPFFDKTTILKEPQLKECEVSTDKLKNMNGYKIKISLFADPPRTVLQSGHFDGTNVRFMKLVMQKINATADIAKSEKINGSYFTWANLEIMARKVDVSFMEHFTISVEGKNKSFSYPHRMDDFVVIVVKATELVNFFNVYEIFDFYTWICALACLVIITVFRKLVGGNSNICGSFIYVWAVFTGNSLHLLFKTKKKVKFVFFLWIFGSLILNIIFASLLASKLIKPKMRKNIDRIEELAERNLKILMSQKFMEAIPEEYGISRHLVVASHLEREQALRNIDDSTAVVVANTVVELIADRSSLYVLKEHLLPGFSMYCFQNKSPYKKKIDDLLFKNVEHGLTKFNENFTLRHDHHKHSNRRQTLLTVSHLKNVILILVMGHTFAASVFVVEIIFVKLFYRENCNDLHYLN